MRRIVLLTTSLRDVGWYGDQLQRYELAAIPTLRPFVGLNSLLREVHKAILWHAVHTQSPFTQANAAAGERTMVVVDNVDERDAPPHD